MFGNWLENDLEFTIGPTHTDEYFLSDSKGSTQYKHTFVKKKKFIKFFLKFGSKKKTTNGFEYALINFIEDDVFYIGNIIFKRF